MRHQVSGLFGLSALFECVSSDGGLIFLGDGIVFFLFTSQVKNLSQITFHQMKNKSYPSHKQDG